MDQHQARVIGRVIDEIDDYLHGKISRSKVVEDVEGLVQAADLGTVAADGFWTLWLELDSELELLTQRCTPPGIGSAAAFVAALESIQCASQCRLAPEV